MTRANGRPRISARRKRLWLWSGAILAGTVALAVVASRFEVRRESESGDINKDLSESFVKSALAETTPVRFTDVTAQAGLIMPTAEPPRRRALPEDNGSGLAWGDYDGDGWPDLYVVRHTGGNRLFHNNHDGTFTDVTERAHVSNPNDFGIGATWIDYDGDGLLDLYVTNRGPNRLYRNRGDGTFEEVGHRAGVDDPLWGVGTAWGDFDRDGNIDFYLCNYVNYDSDGHEPSAAKPSAPDDGEQPYTLNPNSYDPQPNRLFRNRGDGTFEDVTERCGVADPDGRSMSAVFCDLDGDGWPDLYVCNDDSRDRLYRNLGAAAGPDAPVRFVDISALTGTADPRGSMGIAVGEIGELVGNQDGRPDLFITHWVAQENSFYVSRASSMGRLEYRDETRRLRLGEISIDRVGWGCALADFDLDGRIDIAVANGSTLEQVGNPELLRPEPMFIFMNDGKGFRDVAALAGEATRRLYDARGLAVADYDHDGDVDIAIITAEGVPVLLRNDTVTANHSLTVHLKGRPAYCYGARVDVQVGGRMQTQWWGAGTSYASCNAAELIFGLGKAGGADRVTVHWVNGKVSIIEHVPKGVVQIACPPASSGQTSKVPRDAASSPNFW